MSDEVVDNLPEHNDYDHPYWSMSRGEFESLPMAKQVELVRAAGKDAWVRYWNEMDRALGSSFSD